MSDLVQLSMAMWADSYEERQARREIRAKVQEWSDAEPQVRVIRIRKLSRPYPDRPLWWQADVTITRRCPFEPENLTLGLTA